MNFRATPGAVLCALILGLSEIQGCSRTPVKTQQSPTADLQMYHTYAWAPTQAPTDPEIHRVANEKLSKLGLIALPLDSNPDFYILSPAPTSETQEQLTLRFVDAKTGKPFWSGSTKQSLTPDLSQAVGSIIAQYQDARRESQIAKPDFIHYAN